MAQFKYTQFIAGVSVVDINDVPYAALRLAEKHTSAVARCVLPFGDVRKLRGKSRSGFIQACATYLPQSTLTKMKKEGRI